MALPRQSKKRIQAIKDGSYVPPAKKAMKRSKMKTGRKASGEREVFGRIWDSRPHCCQVCKKTIHEARPANFSHLLPKNAYPDFRLDERNIIIKCSDCHALWHRWYEKLHGVPGWNWVCDTYSELKREAYQ